MRDYKNYLEKDLGFSRKCGLENCLTDYSLIYSKEQEANQKA